MLINSQNHFFKFINLRYNLINAYCESMYLRNLKELSMKMKAENKENLNLKNLVWNRKF